MMETWIIPCNTKFFDIANHFSNNDEVIWRNYFTIKTGDLVYIYIGGIVRQIKYSCSVIEANGEGVVTKIDMAKKYIHVKFKGGEKMFTFPDAFDNGYLTKK